MLQDYDMISPDMRKYLRNNGRHFSRKACDFAISQMRKRNNATGRIERVEPVEKSRVDEVLKNNNIMLENAIGYDYVYLYNMCCADFMGSSIEDEAHVAKYVKDCINDDDACECMIFNRWLADMDSRGVAIDWIELL